MPYSYVIDEDLGLVYYLVAGYVTGKELLNLEAAAFNDPARRPNMKIISDIQLASVDVDMDSIKALLSKNRELDKSGWQLEATAFITHSHLLVSLGSAYELMGIDLPLRMKICQTIDEAVEWLELSEVKDRVLVIRQQLLDKTTHTP